MKKVVWISPFLPYPSVPHAGGKIQNYYLNKLIESRKFDVRLIGFYKPNELKKFVLNNKIKCDLFCYYQNGIRKIARNILDVNYLKNPLNRYGNYTNLYLKINIISTLKKYKKEGYFPEIIILEWTHTVLFVDEIKKIFKNVKVVGIEEDVALLSYRRKLKMAEGIWANILARLRFRKLEKAEIQALKKCDLIITNNIKDKALLKEYGVSRNVVQWTPYFQNMEKVIRNKEFGKNILFYGSMSRPENYLSVEWFLNEVKPLLKNEYKYIIIGNNPHESLKKYESKDVIITGFVDDVRPFFKEGLCLVAPLLMGAGVKIKVIEAMSSGLPVLTNQIGIEGIPAKENEDYIKCENPLDYVNGINLLTNDKQINLDIGNRSRQFIFENFNYENDAYKFVQWIENL